MLSGATVDGINVSLAVDLNKRKIAVESNKRKMAVDLNMRKIAGDLNMRKIAVKYALFWLNIVGCIFE